MYKGLLSFLVLFCVVLNAQQLNNPRRETVLSGQVLNKTEKNYFIQNKGQWDPEVKYLARTGGMNAWITNSGVVYDYYKINKNYDESKTLKMRPDEKQEYERKNTSVSGHVVKLQLVNEAKDVVPVGNNKRAGYVNYFTGNDNSKWASNVPMYDNVELQGVYKDIDVKYYYDNGMLRYDYKARPGADISQIKFKFEGHEGICINEKGELVVKTSLGEVTNGKIYAYQNEGGEQKEVECKFEKKEDGTIGIRTGDYNSSKELIIDPLIYSTFIGGSAGDYGNSIAIDAGGNAYITGTTYSSDYPITTGAYQSSADTNGNVFVTKLNPGGTALVYSTFIGGKAVDDGEEIAIDADGNVYITGFTASSDYPITAGAFQATYGGGTYDAFITKLNPGGTALVYSSFMGGNAIDEAASIAVDAEGNAFISGITSSTNYPVTTGAYQATFGGRSDTFITKINSDGSALVYSTYIGGNNAESVGKIIIDKIGNAYITGYTTSANYPVTSGVLQASIGGGYYDVFVTKLNPGGTALVYSTYLGGSSNDFGNSIAVDADGNTFITGYTSSPGFPTTSGSYQPVFGDGTYKCFVAKLNPGGTALVHSTFIGGNLNDYGHSIAIGEGGNIYLTGLTNSQNYPVTNGACRAIYGGGTCDGFLTKLNPECSAIIYSTYIGGNGYDAANSIALDSEMSAYITGLTYSTDYPVTSNAYQGEFNGVKANCFIAKFQIKTPDAVEELNPVNNTAGVILPVQVKWKSALGAESYRLQISTDSMFVSVVSDTAGIKDTTCGTGSLNYLTTYYWRVNASNEIGSGTWSAVWSFKTLGIPTQAVQLYPLSNSADIPLTVNFTWRRSEDQLKTIIKNIKQKNAKSITSAGTMGRKNINNVSQYWFELTKDTTSSDYAVKDSLLVDTVKTVSGLTNLTNYWWRVNAMNEAGWGGFTGWSKFTTIIDTPGVAVLLGPTSSSQISDTATTIMFSWKTAAKASLYRLQIASESKFSKIITDTSDISDTVFTYHPKNLAQTFYWRVQSRNAAGAGSWSNVMAITLVTGVNDLKGMPTAYELCQNYPNPFNPSSKIRFALPFNSNVKIEVYNVLGKKVQELLNEQKTTGYYEVNFKTTGLSSGVYFYVMEAKSIDGKSEYRETKKMLLLK